MRQYLIAISQKALEQLFQKIARDQLPLEQTFWQFRAQPTFLAVSTDGEYATILKSRRTAVPDRPLTLAAACHLAEANLRPESSEETGEVS